MKNVELLLDRPKSCRGIIVIDKANKYGFVGCALHDSKGHHPPYGVCQCYPVRYKVSPIWNCELSNSHIQKVKRNK